MARFSRGAPRRISASAGVLRRWRRTSRHPKTPLGQGLPDANVDSDVRRVAQRRPRRKSSSSRMRRDHEGTAQRRTPTIAETSDNGLDARASTVVSVRNAQLTPVVAHRLLTRATRDRYGLA
jgi:hypothetical protein